MKLLQLSILLFLTNQSFSQTDTLFPNNGATWDVLAWTWDHSGDLEWMEVHSLSYRVYIDNDTIIEDSKDWSSIREEAMGEPKGRIAVDSGKVYFQSYDPNYPVEEMGTEAFVLYDFNLEVGDTAYTYPEIVVVSEISTTLMLGEERKMLILTNGDNWVYGLGSTNGLFYPLFNLGEFGFTLCEFHGNYIDETEGSYQLDYINGGHCLIGIEEVAPLTVSINAISSQLYINNLSNKDQPYTLVNLSGQKVLSGNLKPGNNVVNIGILSTGMYIIQITDFSKKVLISN